MVVPHTAHLPRAADFPFLVVTNCGLTILRAALHRTQYASTSSGKNGGMLSGATAVDRSSSQWLIIMSKLWGSAKPGRGFEIRRAAADNPTTRTVPTQAF